MKKNWMAELTYHYEKTRRRYPQDRLMILFDIDGTILDMRYMVFHVLKAFDKKHDTHFFRKLNVSDITVHENQVDSFLAELRIPSEEQREIIKWYNQHRWSSEYILQSHHPFSGVLEVIRWFQLQPNTFVGLNTGRPESILSDTLRSLNKLGKEYKVQFSDELLRMNPGGWEQEVENSKVAGVRYFQKKGYHIFAFVDNEPNNLKVVSNIDPDQEILLLHANTIFESKRTRLPSRTVKGKAYDITELIPEKELPQHIQFVWHGINDEVNLRQFLASEITWGECDVRMDPIANELILRHDSFVELPLDVDEDWFSLDRLLHRLLKTGKSIKLDLKSGGILVDKALKFIESSSFDESRLWFNGNVERLQEQGFRKLASAHPDAILQCPVDFLAPLISSAPEKAQEILDMFIKWGINRFSINWKTQNMRNFFDQMDKWGFEVNIYNVPDLESFLEMVLLMPRSITSDFNFPKWHYYGRGSGEDGSHYEYSIRKTKGRK
ncbi:hypothetical protein LCGC14_0447460 [marine sediment metagenome]|uniref:Uncharacterized protein n=1 Tax=marine sediment metagenome TaxID=412755 RepID=A0A0F9V5L9_9ZZZZ|nr:hypothetical protein [Candidatus Aminicenantes bacterium]HEB35718.1 hypothetical protein [Candidatus Aminicenantes bacterium]